ncbi:MAG: hypothetical protein KGI04_00745 [Candidatus Micrarchaeota archaeon]|nr:hypothetical protein [Candidatus Micrarchaeota archaeon]
MAKAKNINNNTAIGIGIVIVIVALVAIFAFSGAPQTPQQVTTTASNLSTITINVTTTVVQNITTATGPNLATCNGFNVSISQGYHQVVGTCNWRAGLMNVSVFGGSFQSATLQIVEENTSSSPYTFGATTQPCSLSSNVTYVPGGNYQISFQTSAATAGGCGNATLRLSK